MIRREAPCDLPPASRIATTSFHKFPGLPGCSSLLSRFFSSPGFLFLFLNDHLCPPTGQEWKYFPILLKGVHTNKGILYISRPYNFCTRELTNSHTFLCPYGKCQAPIAYVHGYLTSSRWTLPLYDPFFQNQTGFPCFCIPDKYACIKTFLPEYNRIFAQLPLFSRHIRDRTIDPIHALYQLSSWLSALRQRNPRKAIWVKKCKRWRGWKWWQTFACLLTTPFPL